MESVRSRALSSLLGAQNADGGWGYGNATSWTEPTALAILALAPEPSASGAAARAAKWLAELERSDGGWPPSPQVDQSTWVTALAVLALAGQPEKRPLEGARDWLLRQSGRESGFLRRLRLKLLGVEDNDTAFRGWPWWPGAAAWVTPTALTILAAERLQANYGNRELARRAESGRRFLWARMCKDGGWNHGSSRALGYESNSYPETTGVALLALHGSETPALGTALAAGYRHLAACRSAEGVSWLRLGLLAHSRRAASMQVPDLRWRNPMECALTLAAEHAATGRNVFLE